MKTILLIIGGLPDLQDEEKELFSPFASSEIPSMRALAKNGALGSIITVSPEYPLTTKNALLSILGYDLSRGVPSDDMLKDLGLNSNPTVFSDSLRYFIIPGFSGHGVAVTTSPLVRGVAKMAHLGVTDIYTLGLSEIEALEEIARKAIFEIARNEFVLVYVDGPSKKAFSGDPEAKKKTISLIDRHLVAPLADYVWRSSEMINLAVTSDHISSWLTRKAERGAVPVIIYFNDFVADENEKEWEIFSKTLDFGEASDVIKFLYTFDPESPGNYNT